MKGAYAGGIGKAWQRKRTPLRLTYGYFVEHPFADAIFNRGLAAGLLVLTLPIFAIVAVSLLATQGSKILYRGERLGLRRSPSYIYKFRTLDSEKAKILTANGTLPRGTNLETPLGGFLRKTRLDELPQLFNVLNGTMSFFGPRPVRAELAEIYQQQIRGYDLRFRVKPGLVGFAQALMSHGTDKRYRGWMNRRLCQQPVCYVAASLFVFRVGLSVIRGAITELLASKDTQRIGFDSCPPGMFATIDGEIYNVISTRGGSVSLDRPVLAGSAGDVKLTCYLRGGGDETRLAQPRIM